MISPRTSAIQKEERCIWHKTLPMKSIQSHLVSSNTNSVKQKFQSVVHKPPVVNDHSFGLPNKWHYTKNYELTKKKTHTQTSTIELPSYLENKVSTDNLPLLYFPSYISVNCIAQYYNH